MYTQLNTHTSGKDQQPGPVQKKGTATPLSLPSVAVLQPKEDKGLQDIEEGHQYEEKSFKTQNVAAGFPPAQQTTTVPFTIQKKENKTGLPDNIKSGVETLSGFSMDDVKVHYNSDKPAQLSALAYAQGTDIHVGSGQEKHLAHEAWHVVQQKQGRVKPTIQMKEGIPVNDDSGLEKEADVMGEKAAAIQQKALPVNNKANNTIQEKPVQRMIAIVDDLFVNSAASKIGTEKKKVDQWLLNLPKLTKKKTVTDILPVNFFGLKRTPQPTQAQLTIALNSAANVFTFAKETHLNSVHTLSLFTKQSILQPDDMQTEADDLATAYDASKACVLQALVNAEVANDNVEDAADPASWHKYYYVDHGIQYDDDMAVFEIYTELGLTLVSNQPKKWSALALEAGTYIFSSRGHNFCVEVNETDSEDLNEKYTCKDEPQRRQLRYEADLDIIYVWKK